MSPRPYGSSANAYLAAGYWPVPLPPRKKASPPEGYTGRNGREVTAEDVDHWIAEHRSGNIGLRLPRGVVGVDVDAYKGADHVTAWKELIARCGPLPDAPWCSSGMTASPASGCSASPRTGRPPGNSRRQATAPVPAR